MCKREIGDIYEGVSGREVALASGRSHGCMGSKPVGPAARWPYRCGSCILPPMPEPTDLRLPACHGPLPAVVRRIVRRMRGDDEVVGALSQRIYELDLMVRVLTGRQEEASALHALLVQEMDGA